MEVTKEMVERAMKKAVENGLMPKYADEENYLKNWRILMEVVKAAVEED